MNRNCLTGWRTPIGLFCLVVLLATGACSSDGDLVATVNGEALYVAEVEKLMAPGEGEVVDRAEFRDSLQSAVVTLVVLTKAQEEFGIDPGQNPYLGAVEEEYQSLRTQLEGQYGQYEVFLESQGISDQLVREVSSQQVVLNHVQNELMVGAPAITSQQVEGVFEATRVDLTQVCASHALLETAEEAQEVLERALAGEEMTALAAQFSIEPGAAESGGDLGCREARIYVPEFAEAVVVAEVGIPYGPVESQFGHHVVLVTEREVPLLADHEEAIRAEFDTLRRIELLDEWFLQVTAESDVQVEPQYGTWVTEPTPQVLPPS